MLQFYGVNNVMRQQQISYSDPFSDGGTFSKIFKAQSDGWTPDNLDATWKAQRLNITTTNSTLFLFDGSYFRLKTAEVAYTFQDSGLLKRLGLSSMRVYANGNNLWLVSKMWDDREDSSGDTYPTMKRVNVGLTLNF